jgi:hypothetical protein
MKPELRLHGPVIVALLCLVGPLRAADEAQANPPAVPPAGPQAPSAALNDALEQAVVAEKSRAAKDYDRAIEAFQGIDRVAPDRSRL